MSLAEMMHEDRRLVILRALNEAEGYSLNESILERTLMRVRLGIVDRDMVRTYLLWLERHGLVRVETLTDGASPGELWLATATELGTAVARGRAHPGITRPSAR